MGLRLIKVHTGDQGHMAKVYRDADWDEYRVQHHFDGEHLENADYHTSDKQDATDAAEAWVSGKIGNGKRHDHVNESFQSFKALLKEDLLSRFS